MYKELFPDCTVIVIDGAGHYVHYDKTIHVCVNIQEFFDRIDNS